MANSKDIYNDNEESQSETIAVLAENVASDAAQKGVLYDNIAVNLESIQSKDKRRTPIDTANNALDSSEEMPIASTR